MRNGIKMDVESQEGIRLDEPILDFEFTERGRKLIVVSEAGEIIKLSKVRKFYVYDEDNKPVFEWPACVDPDSFTEGNNVHGV